MSSPSLFPGGTCARRDGPRTGLEGLVCILACVSASAMIAGCAAVSGLDQFIDCADGCESAPVAVAANSDANAVEASEDTDTSGIGGERDAAHYAPDCGEDGCDSAAATDEMSSDGSSDGAKASGSATDSGGAGDVGSATFPTGDSGGAACSPPSCPPCSNPLESIQCCTADNACGCTPNLLGLFCQ
jgi:hypothetical protein